MSTATSFKYLPAQMVELLRGMEMSVRGSMDKGLSGNHLSKALGSSVEFAEYRDYQPGDPIQRIDWSVYARTDRHVIRQFLEEVHVQAYVCLDISESMNFKHTGKMTKLEYAQYLAAGFMYCMVQQGDSAGLVTFDDDIVDFHPAVNSFSALAPQLKALEAVDVQAKRGDIENTMHQLCERIPHKALIVVISDLLQEPDRVLKGLQHLSHDGKKLTVFHTLDEHEITLPREGVAELSELETGEEMLIDFRAVHDAYMTQVTHYLNTLRGGCINLRANYLLVDTKTEVRDTLFQRSCML